MSILQFNQFIETEIIPHHIIFLVTSIVMRTNLSPGLVSSCIALSVVLVIIILSRPESLTFLEISANTSATDTQHAPSDQAYDSSLCAFDSWWAAHDSWRVKQVKLRENIARVCKKCNLTGRNNCSFFMFLNSTCCTVKITRYVFYKVSE